MVPPGSRQAVRERFRRWLAIWVPIGALILGFLALYLVSLGYPRPKMLSLVGLAADIVGAIFVAAPAMAALTLLWGWRQEPETEGETALLDSQKIAIGVVFLILGFGLQFLGGVDYDAPSSAAGANSAATQQEPTDEANGGPAPPDDSSQSDGEADGD
jgi:hypothetical protein